MLMRANFTFSLHIPDKKKVASGGTSEWDIVNSHSGLAPFWHGTLFTSNILFYSEI